MSTIPNANRAKQLVLSRMSLPPVIYIQPTKHAPTSSHPLCQPMMANLSTETVKGATLSLQGVDDIQASYGFSLGVLGVSDSVADNGFKEGLEDTAGFFVDH